MRPSPSRTRDIAPATSVPICPLPRSAPARIDPLSRLFSNDVVILYATALVYISFDLLISHVLSVWLTVLVELIELLPILVGAWFYWTSRDRNVDRGGGIPRILYVPVISTSIQLQILLFAGLERHIGWT